MNASPLDQILAVRQIAYLVIDSTWRILELSPAINQFAAMPEALQLGRDVRDGLPELLDWADWFANPQLEPERLELFGLVRTDTESQQGDSLSQSLPESSTGICRYFDLYAMRDAAVPERYFIVLEDDTAKRRQTEATFQQQFQQALLLKQITQEIRQSLDSQQIFQTAAGHFPSSWMKFDKKHRDKLVQEQKTAT
jgi:hypothetical protein